MKWSSSRKRHVEKLEKARAMLASDAIEEATSEIAEQERGSTNLMLHNINESGFDANDIDMVKDILVSITPLDLGTIRAVRLGKRR